MCLELAQTTVVFFFSHTIDKVYGFFFVWLCGALGPTGLSHGQTFIPILFKPRVHCEVNRRFKLQLGTIGDLT